MITTYSLFDAYGTLVETDNVSPEEAANRAARFILAQASEGETGNVSFSATAAETVTHAKTTHVVIDYDQDADAYWHEREPGDTRPHVMLETVAYDENGIVTGSLCGSEFFEDADDWATGTFYHLSEIPDRCEHLREIAQDLGLPS
jgi:hypothetical protein